MWASKVFRNPDPKVFLEFGAHRGEDTAWLSHLPGVTMHALEPDPRNWPQPSFPNVTQHQKAIAAHDGRCKFILSDKHPHQRLATASSSIRAPKTHFTAFPGVTFGEWIEVDCITLDSFAREQGIETVDFIWADVQGAEGDMIAGGQQTLARTRYVFTEYSNVEWYEGQVTLAQILAMLPAYRIVKQWKDDVLLVNAEFDQALKDAA